MADDISISIAAKDLTEAAFKAVENRVKLLTGVMGGIIGVAGGIVDGLGKIGLAAQGIKAIADSAVSMGSALLKGNAALEMTTVSFTTLLGSASAANDMIKTLTDFAANTPFNLPGLESATQRLLAAGYAAQDIVPYMTAMGDSISALGGTQDQLNSLVYVFGQMRNEAKLNAGDIAQMSNLGIPALQMLATHYGKTTSEIQEMITKGLIPGKDAAAIFAEEMEKKYGGMMAAQSKTFSGMISNLQDWATQTTIVLTKPFFEPAKQALAAFLAYVQSPAGVAAINRLAGYIQTGVDWMTAAFKRLQPQIKPFIDGLIDSGETILSRFTPGVEGLIPQLEALWHRMEPIIAAAYKIYDAFSPLSIAFSVLKGALTSGMSGAIDAFQVRFQLIATYLKQGLDFAIEEGRKYGPRFLSWVSELAISLANRAVVLGEALISWVAPYAVRLVNELISLGGRVLNWVVEWAPLIVQQVLIWGEAIASWVIPAIPRVLTALIQLGLGVIGWMEREVPILTNTLLAWTDTLAGWVIPAIPAMVAALDQMGAAVINWAVTKLPGMLGAVVIAIGDGLGVNLRGPVNDVLLIFNSLVNNIRSTVIPAFLEMAGFIGSDVMPLINSLAAFIASDVIPVLANLAAFAMTVVVPAFTRLAEVVGLVFGPSVRLISSIVQNEVLPTLTGLWQLFDQRYMPTVRSLAELFGIQLANGIGSVVTRFKDSLPAIESFWGKLQPIAKTAWEIYTALSPLNIAFDVFRGFLEGGVQGGLDAFTGHMTRIGDLAQEVIPKLIDGLTTGIPKVLDWLSDQAPKIFDTLSKWGESFGKLVDKVMPPLMEALGKIIGGIFDWITKNGPGILDQLMVWAGMFGEWVKKTIPILIDKLGDLINSLLGWLGDHAPQILETLGEWTGRFVEWAAQLFGKVWPGLQKLAGKLWDWIGEKSPEIADKVSEWAGAFLNWIVTKAIPGWFELAPKIWIAILKFIGEVELNIIKEMGNWAGGFLGWVGDVVRQLPGKLWDIVTGIGTWFGSAADSLFKTAGNIGGKIIEGIIQTIHDAPGKIWDAVTGVLGSGATDIIKSVVQTVANFFVDVVNTPINALNGIIDTLRNLSIGPFQPFTWLPNIPKLGYLRFAQGTDYAPGGPALLGDNKSGVELLTLPNGQQFLTNGPVFLNLPGGSQVTPSEKGFGGNTITIYQTIQGQPDQITLMELGRQTQAAIEEALGNLGQGTVARRGYYGQ